MRLDNTIKFLALFVCISMPLYAQLSQTNDSKPHFSEFFTQGLIINNNIVWESSGLYGISKLTQWNINTGEILKQREFSKKYFLEGLTELNGRLFLLTWKAGMAFEVDKQTLKTIKTHRYYGEGWGLTNNGKQLIMSNGTDTLKFINPQTFKTEKTLRVHIGDTPISSINELEYIDGKIWANVYQTDYIVVIDPQSGSIVNRFHLPHLMKDQIRKPGVLNGIAYDKVHKKTWVTGKNWPLIFEL